MTSCTVVSNHSVLFVIKEIKSLTGEIISIGQQTVVDLVLTANIHSVILDKSKKQNISSGNTRKHTDG